MISRLTLLAAAAAIACSPKLEVPASVDISCAGGNACPAGYACVGGERCVIPTVIDSQGTSPVAPAADSLWAASSDIPFVWSAVTGAHTYTLEIATDNPPTQYVAGTPQAITPTSTIVQLPVGTYYWRVSSDITDASVSETVSRFGVLDGAVYVSCKASESCAADTTRPELGTPQLPYRSINRGIAAAFGAHVTNVRVAVRDSDNVYAETVTLVAGIDVGGGFDPTFATQTGHTLVSADDVALYAVAIAAPTTIAHFTFTSSGTAKSSRVARLIANTDALTLSDVTLRAPTVLDDVLRVEAAQTTAGPVLIGCTVDAGSPGAMPGTYNAISLDTAALQLADTAVSITLDTFGSSARVIENTGGRLTMNGGSVRTAGAQNSSDVWGIFTSGGSVELHDATIVIGTAVTGNASGVFAHNGTLPMTIDATTIDVMSIENATGFDDEDTEGLVAITNSVVRARSFFANGITISGGPGAGHTGRIENSIVEVSGHATSEGVGHATAINLTNANNVALTIAHNTVVVDGDTNAERIGIASYAGATRIIDNAMVRSGAACGGLCYAVVTGDNGATTADIYTRAFTGNAIIGFMPTCGYIHCTTYPDCCLTVTGTGSTQTPHPFFNGNSAPADGGFVALAGADGLAATADDDLHLTSTSLMRGAGHASTADDCRASSGDTSEPAPACGGTTKDHDGVDYATPQSVGAYEYVAPQ